MSVILSPYEFTQRQLVEILLRASIYNKNRKPVDKRRSIDLSHWIETTSQDESKKENSCYRNQSLDNPKKDRQAKLELFKIQRNSKGITIFT